MSLTMKEVAGMIDHTNLKAYATEFDFRKLCDEAIKYGFHSVAVNSGPVKMCRKMLEGSDVLVDATVSFPLGQMTIPMKVEEARRAIEEGSGEIDYVINVGRAKMHDWDYMEKEMEALVAVAHEGGAGCKVIFETCYLSEEEIRELSKIASKVRPDFIKTSTGFGTGGAKPEHVRLMKEYAGPQVAVKAAGGIRDFESILAMIEAGASRIGTSAGVAILEDMKKKGYE